MLKKLKAWFKHSETIFIARFEMVTGAILIALANVDPYLFASFIGAKWFPFFLLGHGILVEILRRRGDETMK